MIQFHLESGRIATSEDEAIQTFQPLKLIPVPAPAPPKPAVPPNNGEGNDGDEEMNADGDENLSSHADGDDYPETARLIEASPTDLPKSNQLRRESGSSTNGPTAGDDDSLVMHPAQSEEPVPFTDPDHSSADTTTLAAGALILAGTSPLRRRFNATNRSLFSVSSRWTRKLNVQEPQPHD